MSTTLRISCCFFFYPCSFENRIDRMLPSWQLHWLFNRQRVKCDFCDRLSRVIDYQHFQNGVIFLKIIFSSQQVLSLGFKYWTKYRDLNCFTLSYTAEVCNHVCFFIHSGKLPIKTFNMSLLKTCCLLFFLSLVYLWFLRGYSD